MEDRYKRTETARPQFGERRGKQPEYDSALSARSDENDVELNGETDDQDMEDGETGFDDGSAQVRTIRDQGQPTVKEHQEHMTTHRPHRSWCNFCVMGRGVNSPHWRSDAQDDFEEVLHVSLGYGFLGERRHKMTLGNAGSQKKERSSPGRKESSEVYRPTRAQPSHAQVRQRAGDEALAREIAQARQEGSQTVPERPPVGESQSNGIIERAMGLVACQDRTLKAALEDRIGTRVPLDASIQPSGRK